MKKLLIPIYVAAIIILAIAAVLFFFRLLLGPPFGEGERARDALERSIATVASGSDVNDLIITTSQWYKLSEFSEDFVSDYNVTWHDYTFGAWEFGVEFPEIKKEYYFDLSFSSQTSKWRVFIKPIDKCLNPRFQIPCILPEYKQVRMETLHGISGVQFIFWYEADPNVVVDKEYVRARIMGALSEDGCQSIPLPEDQNSLEDTYEIGPDDLYYSLPTSFSDPNSSSVWRIHISEDAKSIVLYYASMFTLHEFIDKADIKH